MTAMRPDDAEEAPEQYAGWTLGQWKPVRFPRLADQS